MTRALSATLAITALALLTAGCEQMGFGQRGNAASSGSGTSGTSTMQQPGHSGGGEALPETQQRRGGR